MVKVNKQNVAGWFLGLIVLVAAVLALMALYGPVHLEASRLSFTSLSQLDARSRQILLYIGYDAAVFSTLAFVHYAIDKGIAVRNGKRSRLKREWRRTPEAVLLAESLLGGVVGASLSMLIFHHKVHTWYFVWGQVAFSLLHVALLAYARAAGWL
ncbi:DUF1294 domain-containing protein [Alloscardovia macacae]|uniref:DUF1294 domain-containing protein n=1 Tax=Alloscardovia macacae TaxID=1160091 RepID=A0A261F5J2_9BIFI|nr:DUF1294 domain-containing protein [Alloscardovia macacae]OZG54407.1 hypothetical protein ALMA_0868 [Alloscardovia macacae]